MNNQERRLVARHRAMHAAGERLEAATEARDIAIMEATAGPNAMSKSAVARLLGMRRETVYNAIARAREATSR